jgi:molecular chaperone GrpE
MPAEHENEQDKAAEFRATDNHQEEFGSIDPNGENSGASTEGENDARTDSDRIVELESRVSQLEKENAELKDQYLRKHADFENFRKRMARDKEEAVKFANSQLLLDLIPIIDDFERAIKSSEEAKNFEAFHEGVTLIEKQFVSMLERKWALKRIESVGEPFNPEIHEAIMAEPRSEHEVSMVLEDFQKGYMLNDRVLRSAKVKVSVPVVQSNEDSGNA